VSTIIAISRFIDLTPCVPLSFKGEGEEILERGETPLFLNSALTFGVKIREARRGVSPFEKHYPLPLAREGAGG